MPEGGVHGEWLFHLDHMIASVETVIIYAAGLDQEGFLSDRPTGDAILYHLRSFGEAAARVPDAVRDASPHFPWQIIMSARDRLIHGNLGIDEDALWGILQGDVPALLSLLRDFRARPP